MSNIVKYILESLDVDKEKYKGVNMEKLYEDLPSSKKSKEIADKMAKRLQGDIREMNGLERDFDPKDVEVELDAEK